MPGFASLYFVVFSSMTFCKSLLRAFQAFGTSSALAFHARVAGKAQGRAIPFFFRCASHLRQMLRQQWILKLGPCLDWFWLATGGSSNGALPAMQAHVRCFT
jgi:hypothetical protein